MRLDDPEIVRREYAIEDGLRARASVYEGIAGPDARDAVVEAIAETSPQRVLEVGCGWGDLAVRLGRELAVDVVAVDLSPRMVELACAQGVDARVGQLEARGEPAREGVGVEHAAVAHVDQAGAAQALQRVQAGRAGAEAAHQLVGLLRQ